MQVNSEDALKPLRDEIDTVDKTLVDLFIRRMELAHEIGRIKKGQGLPVLNPARERAVLESAAKRAGDSGAKAEVTLFMQAVMSISRQRQRRDMGGRDAEFAFSSLGDRVLFKRGNLVLVGMPGCGKSTVSRLAAEIIQAPQYDADAVLEQNSRMMIADIFERHGEAHFRTLETQCLQQLLKAENTVIAAGGGAVLQNAGFLKENALVIYLERDLDQIISDLSKGEDQTRPLVRDEPEQRIRALFEERQAVYEAACDVRITNNGSADEAARKVAEVYYAYFGH